MTAAVSFGVITLLLAIFVGQKNNVSLASIVVGFPMLGLMAYVVYNLVGN